MKISYIDPVTLQYIEIIRTENKAATKRTYDFEQVQTNIPSAGTKQKLPTSTWFRIKNYLLQKVF